MKKKSVKPHKTVRNSSKSIRNGYEAVFGTNQGIPIFQPGNLGTQLDQATTMFKNNRWYLISNFRQLLSEFYMEHGICQTIIDVPVDDGFRGGVDIKSGQLSPEQVEELEAAIDKENDLGKIAQAHKWKRLFGGAGVLIFTDQDPKAPLDISRINKDTPLEFHAVDMWELFFDLQNTDIFMPQIQQTQYEYFDYYGRKLHSSRVMKLRGMEAPSFVRPRLRGWGFSVLESFVRSINQYLKATDLAFEVLDEFKIDTYKFKDLANTLLMPRGDEIVRRRVATMNAQKNYQNAVVIDGEDDFIQKQLSFGGYADIMKEIRMQVACDLRMPLTKIFGISAQGFNSGEDDIENYNSMIESTIRHQAKNDVMMAIQLRCQQLFGYIPDDLKISFQSLRMLSAEQEENVKTQKFNRALSAATAGLITGEEFRDISNKGGLFDVQLDEMSNDELMALTPESENEEGDKEASGGEQKQVPNKKPPSSTKAKEAKQ